MTLESWNKQNHWLKKEATSKSEISDLLGLVDRHLKDASIPQLSADARLSIAFLAVLSCATIALRAEEYRLKTVPGHHQKTIDSLQFTLNPGSDIIDKLRVFARKRADSSYDVSGSISDIEAAAILTIARDMRSNLINWLSVNHSSLL